MIGRGPFQEALWIHGGEGGQSGYNDDFWRYDIEATIFRDTEVLEVLRCVCVCVCAVFVAFVYGFVLLDA